MIKTAPKPPPLPLFTKLGSITLFILTIILFFAVQIAGLNLGVHLLWPQADISDPATYLAAGNDGTIISISVLFSLVALSFYTFLVLRLKSKSWRQVVDYLGLHTFTWQDLVKGLVLLLGFIILNEIGTQLLQRKPMDFMDPLFASTAYPWLIIAMVVLVAPFYEELLFRGLLWQSIKGQVAKKPSLQLMNYEPPPNKASHSRLKNKNTYIASIITSIAFAVIHLQYGWYEMLAIGILALLFCYVRVQSGSLFLPIVLHMVNNAIAMMFYFYLS